jgi:hypothetical protein
MPGGVLNIVLLLSVTVVLYKNMKLCTSGLEQNSPAFNDSDLRNSVCHQQPGLLRNVWESIFKFVA